jgi:hypothetical protein
MNRSTRSRVYDRMTFTNGFFRASEVISPAHKKVIQHFCTRTSFQISYARVAIGTKSMCFSSPRNFESCGHWWAPLVLNCWISSAPIERDCVLRMGTGRERFGGLEADAGAAERDAVHRRGADDEQRRRANQSQQARCGRAPRRRPAAGGGRHRPGAPAGTQRPRPATPDGSHTSPSRRRQQPVG